MLILDVNFVFILQFCGFCDSFTCVKLVPQVIILARSVCQKLATNLQLFATRYVPRKNYFLAKFQ
jgi:hypothetical protein